MTTPTADPVIRVEALTKRYGHRLAVDSLSFEVPRGVVAGFIGPNGAGKTTTLAMLLGLVAPSAGAGQVLGVDLGHPAGYLSRAKRGCKSPGGASRAMELLKAVRDRFDRRAVIS